MEGGGYGVEGGGCREEGVRRRTPDSPAFMVSGFRAQGLGLRVWNKGFGVQGSGFKVKGLRFGVWNLGFGV